MKKILFAALLLSFSAVSKSQQIAFPGAEGYGKYSTGGRGGKVVAVTTLQDSVVGSLRWALDQYVDTIYVYKDAANPNYPITVYQPLTVVFKVSGLINLKSDLKVKRDNLTIAGQTAPCDGICITGHSMLINGATGGQLFYWGPRRKNVIIRHLRFRPGIPRDVNGNPTTSYVTYGLDVENYENVIIDHCSISWANEECLAIYDNKNTTVQWCIVSEGLYNAYHAKGIRGYGGVWGGQYASYHHNLLAHQNSRVPRFNGSRAHDTIALVDYRNNVNYNWLTTSGTYGGEVEIPGGLSRINIMNNYLKPGPATPSNQKLMRPDYPGSSVAVSRYHLEGNYIDGNAARTANNWLAFDSVNIPVASRDSASCDTIFTIAAPITMETAQQAYASILASCGAIYPKRDAVDARIITEVTNKTSSGTGSSNKAGIIDDPAVVGGWPAYAQCTVTLTDNDNDGMPDDWELANSLNPNDETDRNNVDAGTGYTMLEVYLNRLAAGLETTPVKLISFNAVSDDKNVLLNWNIANELNNKGWNIERALINNNNWQSVGFVNSDNASKYSFTDNTVTNGIYQYRLKQIDLDGKFSYSNTIIVKIGLDTKTISLEAFPNPANSFTTIRYTIPAKATVKLNIYNAQGQLVSSVVNEKADKGVYQRSVNTSYLAAGKYLLKLSVDGKVLTTQLLKAN
ncbi:T9SS type A sorting domain-containing protein [Ferruginibacter sp. SUN002]|uniref:T9SS type A sorting domain-containing protein n=1 Tax=Ferruginibacter sp. SUN002 TaxID=2937789 RepID=UPI003D3620A4